MNQMQIDLGTSDWIPTLKVVDFSSTKWMLQRQRNIQPVRMIQRLTDGKTQQEPMEIVSLDGWANLYAPQTVFTS